MFLEHLKVNDFKRLRNLKEMKNIISYRKKDFDQKVVILSMTIYQNYRLTLI
ncbi:MAG: hypothetical protein GX984_03405 [Erysipelothrix sp.]|nr:hypothetical protein [Erysipelothrix sp.]